MKKARKIGLTVLGSIVVLVGVGVIWQWENVEAVIKWQTYSQEDIISQIDVQKKEAQDVLKSYGIEGIEDFTFEEEEAIRQGKMTLEEVMQKYNKVDQTAKVGAQKQEGNQNGVETPPESNTPQESAADDTKAVIEDAVTQMYTLKAKYIGQLGELERSARQDYSALSKEQKINGGINNLVSKYSGPAMSLQGQCDAEVSSVLAALKQELQSRDAATDIVSTMQATYEQEKTLKKAYYLSLLNK